MSPLLHSSSRLAFLAAFCVLSACGGGGDGSAGSGSTGSGSGSSSGGTIGTGSGAGTIASPDVVPTGFGPDYSDGQATLAALSAGRTAWNRTAAARVVLKNSPGGQPVTGALTCVSDAPTKLEIAADCSTVKGLRLGVYTVTVSGGGTSAKATVKVIPQPQPLGAGMTTVSALNIAVSPDGRPLVWGKSSLVDVVSGYQTSYTVSLPNALRTRNGQVFGGMVAVGRSSNGTVALSEDGEVYTTGEPTILGRLVQSPVPAYYSPIDSYPGKVRLSDGGQPLQKVVAISMGYDNVMALNDEGQVYIWGGFRGDPFPVGQSGDRILRLLALPDKAVAISAGSNWCIILLANGRVMTVLPSGEGFYNEAGRPASVTGYGPGFVVDRTGKPLEDIVSIAAADNSGFAVNTSGQVWAWGKTDFDLLGQGASTPKAIGALLVRSPDGQGYLSGITSVAGGANHVLALHRSSQVYSWGYNYHGQLGDSRRMASYNGVGLVLNETGTAPLSGVQVIDAGFNSSLALGADGNLRMWGDGSSFGLGQGYAVSYSHLPLLVKNEAGTAPLSFNPMSRWPNLTAP